MKRLTGLQGAAPMPWPRWVAAVDVVRRAVASGAVASGAVASGAATTWEHEAAEVARRHPDDVAVAAGLHGVEGWVRQALGPGHRQLDAAVHAAVARHQRTLVDLALVDRQLTGAGVPFLVAKGPALVEEYYAGRADLRTYVDLDVLVPPRDVGCAVEALEEGGVVLLDANWPLLRAAGPHELRLQAPSGGLVDLHWSLGSGRIEHDLSPSAETLLDRSVPVEIGSVVVRTLAPADMLVHVAAHAAASGGHRLEWLADLRAVLARSDELTTALATADEWCAVPALKLMLGRAQRTLGLAVPTSLRIDQRPGLWAGLVRVAERSAPPELAGTGGSISRLVARSARASGRASIAAAGAKTWAWARGSGSGPTPDVLNDPDDPRSAFHPAGGLDDRMAFFAEVARSRAGIHPSPGHTVAHSEKSSGPPDAS